jgi:hypothetical protein
MPRCGGFKGDGSPCERIVGASQRFCYAHDPARKEERRRAASRAGRSRSGGELGEVRELLREITERVLSGEMSTSVGITVNQVCNTRLRLIEVSRKLQEQQEVLDRLAALEERAALIGGARGA